MNICIVGAGVVGLFCAYYLQRAGYTVTVLDENSEDHQGTSYGNAGMIVPSHMVPLAAPGVMEQGIQWMLSPESPFYIAPPYTPHLLSWGLKFSQASTAGHVERSAPVLRDLSLKSRELYSDFAREHHNSLGLVQKGLYMLCNSDHGLAEEEKAAQYAQNLGIPAEVLSAKDIQTREPEITLNIAGGVHYPLDCHFSPTNLMQFLKTYLQSAGVNFSYHSPVQAFERQNGAVTAVHTPQHRHTADVFVLAAGVWSQGLAAMLRYPLPMQAGRGYSLTVQQPAQKLHACAILSEARVAVTPMNGAMRFGGTMEIAPPHAPLNPSRTRGIVKSVERYMPAFSPETFASLQPWMGCRPCSPDGMPYLGFLENNVLVATGHAMMGMSLAPVTGILITELLTTHTTHTPIAALSPHRYQRS